jgi:riboflavin biosynthesis pyrimidine reductase
VPGQDGGRAISGDNQHDRLLVATLCAVADTIVIGGGTLRTSHNHVWTPEFLAPEYAGAFATLRRALGKPGPPLTVVVSGHGDLDPTERMFQAGAGPALVVTTRQGARRLRNAGLPAATPVAEVGDAPDIDPRELLAEIVAAGEPTDLILLQAGPRLTADFLAARLVDELFLTLSPQIAGRETANARPGLAMGRVFAPDDPLWGTLVDVRRSGSHLFMRYALPRGVNAGMVSPSAGGDRDEPIPKGR